MIKFHCSSCQKKLGVSDEYAGRRVRCPKCEETSIVPQMEASGASASVTGSVMGAMLSASSADSAETSPLIQLQRIPQ
jgi:DNA-directed RNA polymerase subunit RPC12/RpoP